MKTFQHSHAWQEQIDIGYLRNTDWVAVSLASTRLGQGKLQ